MEIVTKIDPVIAEYGRTNEFDLLFDTNQVAFSRPSQEITDALIAKLDTLFP